MERPTARATATARRTATPRQTTAARTRAFPSFQGARRIGLLLLALAPFALVAFGARSLVPRVGDLFALRIALLGRVVRGVPPPPPGNVESPEVAPVPPAVSEPRSLPAGRAVLRRRAAPAASLVVSAERLARLTGAELRHVRGVDAVDVQGRPVGVRLLGVQGLGLGLREGDIVTSLDGYPTPTLDDGTAAATSALGSGRRNAHATILRDGETLAVTVQLPAVVSEASEAQRGAGAGAGRREM